MIPKHGKDSARSKKCKRYKETGRRALNKQKNILSQKMFEQKQKAKNATV